MLIIGLLGGVASGKSRIAGYLRQKGAVVLDADKIGHQVLLDERIKSELRRRWGNRVFDEHGEIKRGEVAKIVFADDDQSSVELRFLESLVHPEIGNRLKSELEIARQADTAVVILDAPVMLKTGWDQFCDVVVFIEASFHQRLERVAERGWTAEMLQQRERTQSSIEAKRGQSSRFIDNSDDWVATKKQLDQLWDEWTSTRS